MVLALAMGCASATLPAVPPPDMFSVALSTACDSEMIEATTESAVAPGARTAASTVAWRLLRAPSKSTRLWRKLEERCSGRKIEPRRRVKRENACAPESARS